MNTDYLISALIVVMLPGTGVIYTVSVGLLRSKRDSIFAAAGCTLGIVPHILAAVIGLAALMHTSAVAFQAVKIAGVCYLLYLAWKMWQSAGITLENKVSESTPWSVAAKGFLINILNPKLSIFFLAFLPQFISPQSANVAIQMVSLGLQFMLITLVVFVLYGLFANRIKHLISESPKILMRIQRGFATAFVFFAAKLASMEK